MGNSFPVSGWVRPGPTEMTAPSVFFCFALLVKMIPPAVSESASSTLTRTKLLSGTRGPEIVRPSRTWESNSLDVERGRNVGEVKAVTEAAASEMTAQVLMFIFLFNLRLER